MLPELKLMGELKKIKNNKPEMRFYCPEILQIIDGAGRALRDKLYIFLTFPIFHLEKFRKYLQQAAGRNF